MIVRILLWRLDEAGPSFEALRERLDQLEPLEAPSVLLVNEAAERVGAVLHAEEDEQPPPSSTTSARSSGASRTSTRVRPPLEDRGLGEHGPVGEAWPVEREVEPRVAAEQLVGDDPADRGETA